MRKWVVSLFLILGICLFTAADTPSINGVKLRNELVWLSNDALAFTIFKANQLQLMRFNLTDNELQNLINSGIEAANANINLRISNNRKYLLWQCGKNMHQYSLLEQSANKVSLEKSAIQPDINSQGDIIFSFYGQAGLYYLREAKSFSQIYPGFCSLQRFSRNGKYIALVNQERFTIIDTISQKVRVQKSVLDLSNRLEWSPNNEMLLLTINPFAHGDFPDTNIAVYSLTNKKLTNFETDDFIIFTTWYDQNRLLYIKKPKLNDSENDYLIKSINLNNKVTKEILRYSKPITSLAVAPDAQKIAFISLEESKLLVYNLKKEIFEVEFLIQ